MNLPGYSEAIALGYTIHYHGGDRKSAGYCKDGVFLDIQFDNPEGTKLKARLSYIWHWVTLSTGWLSWPHPNFKLFEDRIFEAKRKLEA